MNNGAGTAAYPSRPYPDQPQSAMEAQPSQTSRALMASNETNERLAELHGRLRNVRDRLVGQQIEKNALGATAPAGKQPLLLELAARFMSANDRLSECQGILSDIERAIQE